MYKRGKTEVVRGWLYSNMPQGNTPAVRVLPLLHICLALSHPAQGRGASKKRSVLLVCSSTAGRIDLTLLEHLYLFVPRTTTQPEIWWRGSTVVNSPIIPHSV